MIVRFFDNEARHIDPLLRAFYQWSALSSNQNDKAKVAMTWEEKYVMLLWLSHLMLTPFGLDTVSSYSLHDWPRLTLEIPSGVPGVSVPLIVASDTHLASPGKERNAASALLVRLALRPDLQRYDLLNNVVEMANAISCNISDDTSASTYQNMGALTVLAGIFKLGSEEEIAPIIRKCFGTLQRVIENQDDFSAAHSDAYTRRLVIKVVRVILVRSLSSTLSKYLSYDLEDMIDFSIEYFVSSLGDRDTPVRIEASKAVSLSTLKLGPPDDQSIVEGMIDLLYGDIRFEDPRSREILKSSAQDARFYSLVTISRSFENANGLRWHGVLLALARLLLHRSIRLHLLPSIVQTLISGLDFEQRSSKGATSGTQVRDAACFGLWALSRKYSTPELSLQIHLEQINPNVEKAPNLLKPVASSLMICGCLDPQGNMRRGASAALQELIGRHPDMVEHGIPLVQLIDYQGVASRKRAMQNISSGIASLHRDYWLELSRAILSWRGTGAIDASSRRAAANTLFRLGQQSTPSELASLLERISDMLSRLPSQGFVDKRHGLLLALAAINDTFTELSCRSEGSWSQVSPYVSAKRHISDKITSLCNQIHFGSALLGRDLSFGVSRDFLFEGSAQLIASLSGSVRRDTIKYRISSATRIVDTLFECTQTNDQETVQVVLRASEQVFRTMSESEKAITVRSLVESTVNPSSGRLMALAGAYRSCVENFRIDNTKNISFHNYIYSFIRAHLSKDRPIETRCSAWQSLRAILITSPASSESEEYLNPCNGWVHEMDSLLKEALDDYTTDHRGDVGSWVRIEAIRTLEVLVSSFASQISTPKLLPLIGSLVRLAAERLDKVRLQAWQSLDVCWRELQFTPDIDKGFADEREISQSSYFAQLLSWFYHSYPQQIIKGLVTSVSGGTEGLAVATRGALVPYLLSQPSANVFEQAVNILAEDKHDDRYAIPCLHLIAFLLDQRLVSPSANFVKCFAKVELAHYRSANSARLEGALLCYGGLLLQPSSREKALKKVRILQKHPQVKVSVMADDILQLYE